MSLLLKGGRVVDPASGLDAKADVLVKAGRVVRVGKTSGLRSEHRPLPQVGVVRVDDLCEVQSACETRQHIAFHRPPVAVFAVDDDVACPGMVCAVIRRQVRPDRVDVSGDASVFRVGV